MTCGVECKANPVKKGYPSNMIRLLYKPFDQHSTFTHQFYALYIKDRQCTSSTGSVLSERKGGTGGMGGINEGAKYNCMQ